MTIEKALRDAQASLLAVSDAPGLDAERLLLSVLGKEESSWLYTHKDAKLSIEEQSRFQRLIQERATGKPLAYILGEWEFYGRPFYVTPDVLVPRPETEELITQALQYIDILLQKQGHVTVADVGTGSGVIAVTLALETPTPSAAGWRGDGGVKILATDISLAALAVATKNAQRHGVLNRVTFLQGSMLEPLRGKKLDLIVSNPPYVPTEELQSHFAKASRDEIETRGLDFEPKIALGGGVDGQDFIRQIQKSGIPAVVEVTGGKIETFNF